MRLTFLMRIEFIHWRIVFSLPLLFSTSKNLNRIANDAKFQRSTLIYEKYSSLRKTGYRITEYTFTVMSFVLTDSTNRLYNFSNQKQSHIKERILCRPQIFSDMKNRNQKLLRIKKGYRLNFDSRCEFLILLVTRGREKGKYMRSQSQLMWKMNK